MAIAVLTCFFSQPTNFCLNDKNSLVETIECSSAVSFLRILARKGTWRVGALIPFFVKTNDFNHEGAFYIEVYL